MFCIWEVKKLKLSPRLPYDSPRVKKSKVVFPILTSGYLFPEVRLHDGKFRNLHLSRSVPLFPASENVQL